MSHSGSRTKTQNENKIHLETLFVSGFSMENIEEDKRSEPTRNARKSLIIITAGAVKDTFADNRGVKRIENNIEARLWGWRMAHKPGNLT